MTKRLQTNPGAAFDTCEACWNSPVLVLPYFMACQCEILSRVGRDRGAGRTGAWHLGLPAVRAGICVAWFILMAFGARAAAPARIEVRSADLLVVGLVQGDAMSINVSRLLDNAPVRDAPSRSPFAAALSCHRPG